LIIKRTLCIGISTALLLALFHSTSYAHGGGPNVELHVNDRWDECSFVLDQSLTQEAWHQFTREAGLVTYFRPLSSAKPLGVKHFEVALLNWTTQIDETDSAWNDTFSHPDSTHYLADGDLGFPGLMLRVGVTDKVDIGAYFTKTPPANYGFFGGQIQYNFLHDMERDVAAAVRFSYIRLFGPEDLNSSVVGLDVLASKDISRFSPYVGVSGYLARAQETTTKVDLEDENVLGLQGMVGTSVDIYVLKIAGEYNLADVPGYSFKIGYAF
jgi:hypothetical protein